MCLSKFLVIKSYSIKFHFKVILMAAFSYNPVNFIMSLYLHSFLSISIKVPTKQGYHEWRILEKGIKDRNSKTCKKLQTCHIFPTLYSYALQSKGIDFNTTAGKF